MNGSLVFKTQPKIYMSQVNLDALIKRDDLFKINDDDNDSQEIPQFKELRIDSDLNPKKAWFFNTLKKPDFQRETSEWKPDRIAGLIKSFINDDIIPSIILWNWKGDNFIIDGGHRVAAIIGWILDDFGDGTISKNFFGEENITKEQKRLANKTRELLKDPKNNIGSFADIEFDFNNPDKVPSDRHIRAKRILINRSLQVQWIKAKTSKDAEQSFFRINGEATPINETEAIILKSREKPNAIASRAIIHAGNAHKYWGKFIGKEVEIEKIATDINTLLFDPELDPKVIHFPIAGNEYSTHSLELVFGIVNMINGLDDVNFKRKELLKKNAEDIIPAKDETGEDTLKYLNKIERVISIISGKDAISLGLSPVIYFYSYRGRFQITSFFAIVHLIIKWDEERHANPKSVVFQKFSSVRGEFEDFLLENKNFITQATLNIGSGIKSYKRLADLFSFIINKLIEKKHSKDILEAIQTIPEFGFVKIFEAENKYNEERNPSGAKPPKETAVAVVINTFLSARILCPICKGHATFDSYNLDHILEIKNGGKGIESNLQVTHYYCNEEKNKIAELKIN
jgi:hypothetical protein